MTTAVSAFENVPRRSRFISLTTYRRSGVGVATPVWFARSPGGIYVVTFATAGKVRRINNNATVAVAPCRSQGKVTGPEAGGRARLLVDSERRAAAKAISRRYFSIPTWLIEADMRRRGGGKPAAYLEIVPGGPA